MRGPPPQNWAWQKAILRCSLGKALLARQHWQAAPAACATPPRR
ncbi:hypothetical protein ACVXG8_01160 [Escherichia coli]